MLTSVLIANRGEIARRIIRTARRMGMRTVAVYSDADRGAPHMREADHAVRIGPAPASQSYLRVETLIDAALSAGADCVHPGYGFLSERAEFAEACAAAGLIFVGPPPRAIRAMGLKDAAKALMERAGVPVVPGYHGAQQQPDFLAEQADAIGYPVLIKAVAGGGGKGMRRVDEEAAFQAALEAAKREAQAAFGDPRVLIEKYIASPRHIEVQIFADTHGNVVHLNERDCSLQRRHQKVVEEAPAPGMTPELRNTMGSAAIEAARAVGYVGAGTVEFIADGSRGLREDAFFFMEMNTRLQVEHPVTEAVTGFDLVEWQFRVAAGERLPVAQHEVPLRGHAVEARVYAEDPERGFLPSTGRIQALEFPSSPGIRVDAGVESGSEVTPFYDPMIAKVIAHAPSRPEALDRLADALEATVVAGPRSNTGFLARLARLQPFRDGVFHTGTIDQHLGGLTRREQSHEAGAIAAAVACLVAREQARITKIASTRSDERASPWAALDGWSFGGSRAQSVPVLVDGEPMVAVIQYGGASSVVRFQDAPPMAGTRCIETDDAVYAMSAGRQTVVRLLASREVDAAHLGGDSGTVNAPMHGKVLAIDVGSGATVTKGQRLLVLEAMKMEHVLLAPQDGVIAEIHARTGEQVSEGARLLTISPQAGET